MLLVGTNPMLEFRLTRLWIVSFNMSLIIAQYYCSKFSESPVYPNPMFMLNFISFNLKINILVRIIFSLTFENNQKK